MKTNQLSFRWLRKNHPDEFYFPGVRPDFPQSLFEYSPPLHPLEFQDRRSESFSYTYLAVTLDASLAGWNPPLE